MVGISVMRITFLSHDCGWPKWVLHLPKYIVHVFLTMSLQHGRDEDMIALLGALDTGVEHTSVCEGESALTVDGQGCPISQVRCNRFPVCLYSMVI